MFLFFLLPIFTVAAVIQTTVPTVTTDIPLSSVESITVPTRTQDEKNAKLEERLPFLKSADELSRQEFFSIIQNDKLSKSEIWERVEQWAEKQSEYVKTDIMEFHQRLSQHVDNSKMRVERIIKNLPEALRRLSEIVQDIDITRVQEKNRIANLYTSLDDDVSKTLQWIVHLVSYERNEGKQLERRNKLRKLKKGGIWTGSVQATNII
ncbi:hypothetical protein GCK72_012937 [Caenorhabditis remanei]|uniref:SXP/RAL-2 family protein Ani s 5-like cation-binding domain-containing protein n=2 Tax=Caenorhabditis remanei TaxID=31234 RepID=E3N3M0_CAERE|nr:hypothetical protein GCK72_012937 [Caenorhabditis remanei]EFO85146.1 hypothetical protein CRE_21433 [Caenorhabditis remanei]KAF1756484.1 hypothetical protein GCK72_012937 [Caenorhabditis remanei]